MKKKILHVLSFCYFFTCFFILFSNTAHAYIDPSTTTYIIQGIAGILVAIGAVFTVFRHKIIAAWRKWYYGRAARKYQNKEAAGQQKAEGKENKS